MSCSLYLEHVDEIPKCAEEIRRLFDPRILIEHLTSVLVQIIHLSELLSDTLNLAERALVKTLCYIKDYEE